MGRLGTASITIALLSILGRAVKLILGLASAGSSIILLLAVVILYNLCLSY